MSINPITDKILKELCDKIENLLEKFVVEYKGRLFDNGTIIEEGMEVQIKNQYESYLSNMVLAKGGNVKLLSQKQQEYVKNRIKNTLELSKKQYES
ncbi:MAG: hypothetical protein HW410_1307 [Nitrosarchaeum sp.]|nr:hypothetical protein [Nitrosarchaeum sp.]